MSDYYCPECTKNMISGSAVNPSTLNLSGSSSVYNLYGKYEKHVLGLGTASIKSVFTKDDIDLSSKITYDKYEDYCITTSVSGSLEIDDKKRYNLVWLANQNTGITYINGSSSILCNAVKLVYYSDQDRIHAYPTSSNDIKSEICASCGKKVFRPSI